MLGSVNVQVESEGIQKMAHDVVDARADDERGLRVVRRRLEIDDNEALRRQGQVGGGRDAQRGAEAEREVGVVEGALRGLPVAVGDRVVPVEHRVAELATASHACLARRLEADAADVAVARHFVAARRAPLGEHAPVEHGELVSRKPRPQVEPVDVLRRAPRQSPRPRKRRERAVRWRRPRRLERRARGYRRGRSFASFFFFGHT
mmetsp:Transcript_18543/g.74033  ORF Transcript_18543/g.74033 Transcript_18543/m.74033 type:complete len:205 (+) Transcript_18543:523-1137(+)